jgi:flagellar biogenesis protein FliO
MLTFDKPYLGKISKKKDEDSTILKLENIHLEDSITEDIKSKILQNIRILPYKEQVFIKVDSKQPYKIEASKTIDNYGLRIRVKPHIIEPIKTKKFETKKEEDLTGSFLKVIAVLGFLLGMLYLLKRWILNSDKTQNSWLFHKDNSKKQDIKILYQKALDTKNRVALIEYNDTNYLVILGSNNLVLDKFKSDEKDASSEFDSLLNKNERKLDELLKLGSHSND